jgi:hypothetical protein
MPHGYSPYQAGKFQTQVHYQQAPGVEGDFCDHNVRTTVDAGPGGLVTHFEEGCIIGRFAWLEYSHLDPNNAPTIARTKSTGGAPAGFIHREQQGLITDYLGGSGMWMPGGFPVTLHQTGGFFVINRGSTYAQIGMKAFARGSDGAVLFGAAGSAPNAATFTGTIASQTATFNGSIAGNVLTVEEIGTGKLQPGATVNGTGLPGDIIKITAQLSGTPGGTGTYALNLAELAIPEGAAMEATYGVLSVTNIASGSMSVGSELSGGTEPAFITAFDTGTGQLGNYIVDNPNAGAVTTASDAVETKWFATSAANPGELMKMSSYPLG